MSRPSLGYSNWYWIKKDRMRLEKAQKEKTLLLEQKEELEEPPVSEPIVSEPIVSEPIVSEPVVANQPTTTTTTVPPYSTNAIVKQPQQTFGRRIGGNNEQ